MSKNILNNINVIIPVHELNEETSTLLGKALNSVAKVDADIKVSIVHPDDEALSNQIIDAIASSEMKIELVEQIVHNEEIDFCTQINYGVSKLKTKYFSILELDDEYSDIYFKNVNEYLNAYPNVSAYLPITIIVDKENKALGLANQAVWAYQFSDKQGFLDVTSLLQYNSFMISGAVIDREAFEEVGGLKKDIKMHFIYEFLLRFVNNDYSTMVIPKIGYKHMFGRDNSLFAQYGNPDTGIKPDEAKFYLESAKNEYFFNPKEHTTRLIKYSSADAS